MRTLCSSSMGNRNTRIWLKRNVMTIQQGAPSFPGEILQWLTSWKVSQVACDQGQNMLGKLVVIYGDSRQSFKSFLVTVYDLEGVREL